MKINVLTDYRGWIFSSVKLYKEDHIVSMNVDKLRQYSKDEGIELYFIKYSEINISDDYSGQFFIYSSSEDPRLIYKGYMEDILYVLSRKGAILIPEWRYMRAHHNKALMEMLRDVELNNIDTGIHSKIYGCNEEFIYNVNNINFPCVFKTAEGAGSNGVALLKNKEEALSFLEEENINHKSTIKEKILKSMGRLGKSVHSNHRNKFIIQNFIPNLSGDFKILIFGEKYYALSRKNRENDFRASGGGKLNYEPVLPDGILDFAKSIYDTLNVPVVSLDVAYNGIHFYLIEFQCIHFGTATLEYSTHYYKLIDNQWTRFDEQSILEKEYMISLKGYIIKNYHLYEK